MSFTLPIPDRSIDSIRLIRLAWKNDRKFWFSGFSRQQAGWLSR